MVEPAGPFVLGTDCEDKRWSEGELTARVRSLSEPDRAVPLTAPREVVSHILATRELLLKYLSALNVTVGKAGFDSLSQPVELELSLVLS